MISTALHATILTVNSMSIDKELQDEQAIIKGSSPWIDLIDDPMGVWQHSNDCDKFPEFAHV